MGTILLLLLCSSTLSLLVSAVNPNEDNSLGSQKVLHDLFDKNNEDDEDVSTKPDASEKSVLTLDKPKTLPYFPNIKRMYKSAVKPAGSTASLKCKGDGNPLPNITWYKNNDTTIRRVLGETKYTKWGITLEELVTNDSGHYKCVLCNIIGCVDFTYELEIIESANIRPIIMGDFNNISVPIGGSANMSCRVASTLNAYIQWVKGLVDDKNFASLQQGEGNPNRELLEIHNVTHEDEGWYTCVASNTLGHTVSSAYLQVVDGKLGLKSAQYEENE